MEIRAKLATSPAVEVKVTAELCNLNAEMKIRGHSDQDLYEIICKKLVTKIHLSSLYIYQIFISLSKNPLTNRFKT